MDPENDHPSTVYRVTIEAWLDQGRPRPVTSMIAKALRFVEEAGFSAANDDSNEVVNEDPSDDLEDANEAIDAFQADEEAEAPEPAEPKALGHVDEDIIDPRLLAPVEPDSDAEMEAASEDIQMAM